MASPIDQGLLVALRKTRPHQIWGCIDDEFMQATKHQEKRYSRADVVRILMDEFREREAIIQVIAQALRPIRTKQ